MGLKLRSAVVLLFSLVGFLGQPQCAMCRAVLQSDTNTGIAKGVNDGIVYLMAIPYILVGILAIVLYKVLTKKKA